MKVIPISGVTASSVEAASKTSAASTTATQWLSGLGAPLSDGGNNGDFYLDTSTGDVYKKSDGSWNYQMNLRGEAGPIIPEYRLGSGWACDTFAAYDSNTVYLNQGIGWDSRAVGSGMGLVNRTTANSKTETLLTIAEGGVARKFAWGNRWNRLRVCVLARINGDATFDADFALGVCSGTSYPFSSTATKNFCGVWTRPGEGNTWTLNTGTAFNVFSSEYMTFVSRVAGESTERGVDAGSPILAFPATAGYATPFVLDIYREPFSGTGAGNYVCAAGGVNVVTNNFDWTYASALEWVRGNNYLNASAPVVGGNAVYAFSESGGALDSFNLYWSNVDHPLEIRAIIVWRLH